MLVVIVVGLIYGLFLSNMKRYGEKQFNLNLMSLPSYLQSLQKDNALSVVCIDACRSCFLFVDGLKSAEVDPFVDDSLRLYRHDRFTGSEAIELTPLFDEEGREYEVCFRYDLYSDGSSSEMMVEYGESVVDYAGYFTQPRRYASLEEAIEEKNAFIEKVLK